MQLIPLLLLLVACGLTMASRRVTQPLTSDEVRQVLRAAGRLDAIPLGHEVVGDALAVLDEQPQTSARFFGGGFHSFKEVCFNSAPRQRRLQLARTPTTPNGVSPIQATGTTSPIQATGTTSPIPITPSMSPASPPYTPITPITPSPPAFPTSAPPPPTLLSPTSVTPISTPPPTAPTTIPIDIPTPSVPVQCITLKK